MSIAYSVDEIVSCREAFHRLPTSMVGLDGVWHCDHDFGYAPILDFELGKQHPDNVEPERQWRKFLNKTFFFVYEDHHVAVLDVHS